MCVWLLAAFPSTRPFNTLPWAADKESVVLSLVRLFWIPLHVFVSVNTALLGTDLPNVYVQATGFPLLKYTGWVAEPADESNLTADVAEPPAEDEPAYEWVCPLVANWFLFTALSSYPFHPASYI